MPTKENPDNSSEDDYQLMILKNRLAKGEISIEEFKNLKQVLDEHKSLENVKSVNISKEKIDEISTYNENKVFPLTQDILDETRKAFEYSCNYVDGHTQHREKSKGTLLLNRQRKKTNITFRSKDNMDKIVIPILSLESAEVVTLTHGFFKTEDRMIRLRYVDAKGTTQMPVFKVDEKYIDNVLRDIARLKNDLIEPVTHKLKTRNGIRSVQVDTLSSLLHHAEGTLWSQRESDDKSKYDVSKIVTNYRVFAYDHEDDIMLKHIFLSDVDDVVVVNRHVSSKSQGTSYIVGGYGNHTFGAVMPSNSQGQSKSIGDVVFMRNGKPYIMISSIPDPDGVVTMIKSVMNELYPRVN